MSTSTDAFQYIFIADDRIGAVRGRVLNRPDAARIFLRGWLPLDSHRSG